MWLCYTAYKEGEEMTRLNWEMITSEKRIPEYQKENDLRELRSEMESDYLRIIRSASFRRLQDKTQVFPLDNSDFVRTRLTHSLEAASIAKLIAKQICTQIESQQLEAKPLDSAKICETLQCAALLHDIGNPPFGHFGETAIRDWFQQNLNRLCFQGKPLSTYLNLAQQYDLLNYEGNAQALRIILKLHRHTGNHGMHLTSAVMDAIIKYPCDSMQKHEEDEKPKAQRSLLKKKIGYFQSEAELVTQIKENTGCNGCRNPLAFILEAADDLAYTFADLEDGYNKGLYTYDALLELCETIHDSKESERLKHALKTATSVKAQREKGFDPYKQAVFDWLNRKQLYGITCVCRAFMDHYEEIMSGTFAQELLAVSSEASLIQALKRFSYEKIYCIAPILKLELMGNEILTFLLDRFMDALIVYDSEDALSEIQQKYIDLLSRNYLDSYTRCAKGKEEGERLYLRLLLGCDYIAGMSDGYAQRMYRELKGFSSI